MKRLLLLVCTLVIAVMCVASAGSSASARANSAPQVRQAEDADLIVKEWRSPITFEVDASWLATLPVGNSKAIDDLPSFNCDSATLESMKLSRTNYKPGSVRLTIEYVLSVQASSHDKFVDLEFTLLGGDLRLPLGRVSDVQIAEGDSRSLLARYDIPDERFARYLAEGSNPQLRVSMIVRND